MSKSVRTLSAMFLALALTQPTTSQEASWVPLGTGCPGSVGVPLLEPMQSSLPFLGEVFRSQVGNLPDSGLGVGLIGLSDQIWNSLVLPASLEFLAMPGCVEPRARSDPRRAGSFRSRAASRWGSC